MIRNNNAFLGYENYKTLERRFPPVSDALVVFAVKVGCFKSYLYILAFGLQIVGKVVLIPGLSKVTTTGILWDAMWSPLRSIIDGVLVSVRCYANPGSVFPLIIILAFLLKVRKLAWVRDSKSITSTKNLSLLDHMNTNLFSLTRVTFGGVYIKWR